MKRSSTILIATLLIGTLLVPGRVPIETEAGTMASLSGRHLSNFVNATLKTPDRPHGANFKTNSLQQVATADPSAGITWIEPPDATATGDAALTFPLVVPPGRRGLEPALSIDYTSGAGNGWLGIGWDLQLPKVEVDTRFGVPRYDPNHETETYLLNGDQLAPTADALKPAPRTADRAFTRRVEGPFERIVRHGNRPEDYWWEVTHQDGTRFIYGRSDQARLFDDQAPHPIFRWQLEQIIDVHGNTVDYEYFTDRMTGRGEPSTALYPRQITYTGFRGAGGFYRVRFHLDDGDRPDRFSSGMAGFKVLTRFRLDHIEVLADHEQVRRYDLIYRTGDFQKTLLEAIAVFGQDGARELYRHTFDYFGMATRPNGDVDGFSPQQTWGGMASSDDASHTSSFSAGVHSFVGLAPNPACQLHAGVQVGASGGASSVESTFVDVNGDGLPDRLDQDGRLELNREGSFERTRISGTDLLARTQDLQFDVGTGVHAPAELAQAGTSFVWSHANDDHAISDVNGDGWPDLVATQGSFAVRLNDRGQRFLDPVSWDGFSLEGIDLEVAGEKEQVLDSFPLSNALRQLELPFTGRVSVGGPIRKLKAGGDGVKVTLFHGSKAAWARHVDADETGSCAPGPDNSCRGGLTLDVKAGERLYFMADSIADTSHDALAWAPSVTYLGRDGEAREPYGSKVFVFDGGTDFRLAGPPGGDWLASAKGTVRVLGTIEKQATADDVTITISRARSQDEPDRHVPVFHLDLAASQTGSFGDFPEIDVEVGDVLRFAVNSDSQIDPSRIRWMPKVTYRGGVLCLPSPPGQSPTEICGPLECHGDDCTIDGKPAPVSAKNLTQPAQVLHAVHNPLPLNRPTVFWTATAKGAQKVKIDWRGPAGGHRDPVRLYVQGLHALFDKRQISAGESQASYTVPVHLPKGAPLYVTVLAARSEDAGTLTATVNGASVPTNRRWIDSTGQALSGGFHRWSYGEWNGSVPFQELDDPKHENLIAGVPQWQGTRQIQAPMWRAAGFDLYHTAAGSKPSRRGGNVVADLGVAAGQSGAGPHIVRKSYSHTLGANVSAGVAFTTSHAESVTQIDLVDVNGDRYPDQVTEGKVRFSNGHGGFGPLVDVPGLDTFRESADGSYSLSVGLGIPFKKKDGAGKPKQVINTLPSVGRTLSFSQSRTELIDVNGDSLPDRVSMDPNAQQVTVRLNLGYRFGAAETWPLPAWKSRELCNEFLQVPLGKISSADSPDALTLSRSAADNAGLAIGPFGGGVATSVSRHVVELADINGDGLPDHLFKDQGEDFFRVKLNLGDRWADETRWYVPAWQTSLGGKYNALGLFQCLDAVTLQGSIDGNGSAGAPICIPLVPPVPVAGLQIEISAQGGGGSGGVQLLFEDVNGDGLADQVLKKSSDTNVYTKLNQAGRVHLLRRVDRPLGGSFELDYRRQGNRVDFSDPQHKIDMPSHQWALAEVTVDDGRGHTYTTDFNYFNDAFYDRMERQAYGYARVETTLPDGSVLDRYFHNQNFYLRHLPVQEVRKDATGRLFTRAEVQYELRPVGAPGSRSFFPARVDVETSFYEGTTKDKNAAPKSTRQVFDYGRFGNPTHLEDFADVGPEDDTIAEIAYRMDPALYIVRPERITVRDRDRKLLRQRRGTYDSLGELVRLEQTLLGGIDPETGAPYNGSKNAITTLTWDDRGNLASVTDPTGFTETYAYDPVTETHVHGIEDSFGYTSAFEYDLRYGQWRSATDPNGNVIRRVYDGFGRLDQVFAPAEAGSSPTIAMEYAPDARPAFAVTHHQDVTRPGDPINTVVFVDGLLRPIQTQKDIEIDRGTGRRTEVGRQVSGRVTFDVMGRVAAQGQPIFDRGATTRFVDVPQKNPTHFDYDILGRTREVLFPDGATTRVDYAFGSLDGVPRFLTSRTDAEGRVTRTLLDVHGAARGVEQSNTIRGVQKRLTTRYDYNPLSELISVRDASGNPTRIELDTLGRRTIIDNLDAGRTEFRYDPGGNLVAKITANLRERGQEIRYHHTFHRLDRIDYPVMTDRVFTYGPVGAPANRAGRIWKIEDESGTEERSYGPLGEVVVTTKTVISLQDDEPQGPYTTKFVYDSFHRLLRMAYPDGEVLTYRFDAGGRAKSVRGQMDGTQAPGRPMKTDFVYVAHLGYDEFGQKARIVYGNGVESRFDYDPEMRRLAGLHSVDPGGRAFQKLHFQYNQVGSILGLENDVEVPPPPILGGPVQQRFHYDDLYQLIGAEGNYRTRFLHAADTASIYSLSASYDETGNLLSKSLLHQMVEQGGRKIKQETSSYDWTYQYRGPQPHAATHVGDRTFTFDSNGNQTGWEHDFDRKPPRSIAWDEENRVKQVADTGATTRFLYNADGQRANKSGVYGETVYLNSYFSVGLPTTGSKHVYLDGTRIATQIAQPALPTPRPPKPSRVWLYYYHPSHLGSTQYVTDRRGEIYQHLEYFPFGEPWVDKDTDLGRHIPYTWSAQERDDETGYYAIGFRYLEPRQGQWISPDPIFDRMLDPNALQKPDLSVSPYRLPGQIYAYAGNDPVNLIDPTGLAAKNTKVKARSDRIKRDVKSRLHRKRRMALEPSDFRGLTQRIRNAQALQKKVKPSQNVGIGLHGSTIEILISGAESRSGALDAPSTRRYSTQASGFMTRANDTEVKFLESVARRLRPGATGPPVVIYTERPPCFSCRGVIADFKRDFPNVPVRIISQQQDRAGHTEFNF